MSQQSLAEAVGTTQSNVAKWERGAYKPSPQLFLKLSTVFEGEFEMPAFMEWGGVPKEYFLGATQPNMMPTVVAEAAIRDAQMSRAVDLAAAGLLKEGDIRMVPLLRDPAAAGTPHAIDETVIERLVPIPEDWLPSGGELFMLKVEGDSMSPVILDGALVIVDVSQNDPRKLANAIVVANDGGVALKWLCEDRGTYLLAPNYVSASHPVRVLKKGSSVIGRVVKWIGEPPLPKIFVRDDGGMEHERRYCNIGRDPDRRSPPQVIENKEDAVASKEDRIGEPPPPPKKR